LEAGVVGLALDAGAGSRLFNVPADEYAWSGSNSYTIEFWLNPRSDGGAGSGRIMSNEQSDQGVFFHAGLDSGTHVNMNAKWNGWSGTNVVCTAPTTIPLNVWTHIVCTWSTTNNLFKIYYNAALQTLVTSTPGVGTPPDDTGWVWNVLNSVGSIRPLDGILDELRFYRNVELTQEQITQRYNDTVPS
ncbi:MAG TPA: LamG domain-containing protein, partial [Patescibacteria group bacterium]|nr:LamG domain-containing protein [Patescibacteria group bacterium]